MLLPDGKLPYDNGWGSHMPILAAVLAKRVDKPILEFGCGFGSTPMLHACAARHGVELHSAESNEEWLRMFADRFAGGAHYFHHVPDGRWDRFAIPWLHPRWSVAFIDQAPAEARGAAARAMADRADYVVVHDVDHPELYDLLGLQKFFRYQATSDLFYPATAVFSNVDADLPRLTGR